MSRPSICFYCADQNPHRDRSRGITGYTYSLISHLQKRNVRLEAVTSKSSFALPPGVPCKRLPFRTDNPAGRLLGDQLHPWLGQSDAALWHYPKGFLPLALHVKGRTVGTVADTILQHYADHYPETRRKLDFTYWLKMLARSISRFDLILTVSEFSRREIIRFCRRHRLRCPEIVVTFEGADIPEELRGAQVQQEDYVIHLASKLPHKRTNWLLSAWAEIERSGDAPSELRLVGEIDAAGEQELAKLKSVRLSPPLDRLQLLEEIRRARALLLPSEIEGFGLPALEAYLLGVPVVFVAGTAVAEVIGDSVPGGYAPDDRRAFVSAVREVLEMPRDSIATHRALLAERFSWEGCADRTIAAYQSLVGSGV